MAKQRGSPTVTVRVSTASRYAARGYDTLGSQFEPTEGLTDADKERLQRADMYKSKIISLNNNRGTLRFRQIT